MAEGSVWGLIVAVGRGQQLTSGADTAFLGIGSRPALAHSLAAFDRTPGVDGVVIVVARDRIEAAQSMVRRYGCGKPARVVAGFQSHRASLRAGLEALEADAAWVVVHEAARPCVTPELIAEVLAAARRFGNGVAAARMVDPVALAGARTLRSEEVCSADATWVLQTPQAYRRSLIERLLDAADKAKLKCEDLAAALPRLKEPIRMVAVERVNLRLVSADDLALASNLLP